MAAPPIKYPTRVSHIVQAPRPVPSQMDLVTAAELGRLRYLAGARKTLALGIVGPVLIADANGARGPRYVRVRSAPGTPVQQTFFSTDTEPSLSNSDPLTLTGNDFFEQLLLPGEALYARNNGVVAYQLIVYQVQV